MNREQRREWRRHVFGCADLTLAERLVLLALEGFADYPDGANARPGRAALAEICGLGTRVVDTALARGRRLKLIEQTARANPKRGLAAVYQLVSTRTCVQVETDSTRTSVQVETDFNSHETTFQRARDDVSTRTSVRATNPLTPIQNTKGGGLRQSGTSPDEPHPLTNDPPPQTNCNGKQPDDPEPPQFYPRHPGGTYEGCRACGQARLNYEAWKRKNDERAAARKAAIRKAIDACDDCDDYGRPFKGPLPHCPKHPNFRQLAESTVADPDPIPEPVAGDNRIGPYIAAISEAKSIDKGGTA
jgi:hypothetical protein